jgi:hypothetical protein
MSDEESAIRAAAWERFKQSIDADRPDGSKLYSRSMAIVLIDSGIIGLVTNPYKQGESAAC